MESKKHAIKRRYALTVDIESAGYTLQTTIAWIGTSVFCAGEMVVSRQQRNSDH